MRLTWSNIPEQPPGSAEVAFSREAIAEVIRGVMPRLQVDAHLLTFVPLEDGSAQVNVHGYGPFGVLSS